MRSRTSCQMSSGKNAREVLQRVVDREMLFETDLALHGRSPPARFWVSYGTGEKTKAICTWPTSAAGTRRLFKPALACEWSGMRAAGLWGCAKACMLR